jgi:hypothetical protein
MALYVALQQALSSRALHVLIAWNSQKYAGTAPHRISGAQRLCVRGCFWQETLVLVNALWGAIASYGALHK